MLASYAMCTVMQAKAGDPVRVMLHFRPAAMLYFHNVPGFLL
ncbi:hypothetical protein [Nitrosomonas sp. sh817]|nr:hypothetical protein [Nitrosomonas sp. sh817]WMJ09258.1 hypothetical protein RBH92_03435 [Nitrosomonas sp. sh817]